MGLKCFVAGWLIVLLVLNWGLVVLKYKMGTLLRGCGMVRKGRGMWMATHSMDN